MKPRIIVRAKLSKCWIFGEWSRFYTWFGLNNIRIKLLKLKIFQKYLVGEYYIALHSWHWLGQALCILHLHLQIIWAKQTGICYLHQGTMQKTQPYALKAILKLLLASPAPGVTILSLRVGFSERSWWPHRWSYQAFLRGCFGWLVWLGWKFHFSIVYKSVIKELIFHWSLLTFQRQSFHTETQLNVELIINSKSLLSAKSMKPIGWYLPSLPVKIDLRFQ